MLIFSLLTNTKQRIYNLRGFVLSIAHENSYFVGIRPTKPKKLDFLHCIW